MKRPKIVSEQTFELLKDRGHAVPRDSENYVQTNFGVGKEYTVKTKNANEVLNVICTQNCPHHLKVI